MVRYFILIRKKKTKQWKGAIPTRRGISLAKIKKLLRTQLRQGYQGRIVTEAQLKRLLIRTAPRRAISRRRTKRRRKVKRRKKARRKRRRRRRR